MMGIVMTCTILKLTILTVGIAVECTQIDAFVLNASVKVSMAQRMEPPKKVKSGF